ncbi:hypothetical protein F4805DRAFT_461165 [Annulohypoxylon moriforme]|nr:hypothetical protein F4805DRAFT_461165 [Annulohypoxylon moriforme]
MRDSRGRSLLDIYDEAIAKECNRSDYDRVSGALSVQDADKRAKLLFELNQIGSHVELLHLEVGAAERQIFTPAYWDINSDRHTCAGSAVQSALKEILASNKREGLATFGVPTFTGIPSGFNPHYPRPYADAGKAVRLAANTVPLSVPAKVSRTNKQEGSTTVGGFSHPALSGGRCDIPPCITKASQAYSYADPATVAQPAVKVPLPVHSEVSRTIEREGSAMVGGPALSAYPHGAKVCQTHSHADAGTAVQPAVKVPLPTYSEVSRVIKREGSATVGPSPHLSYPLGVKVYDPYSRAEAGKDVQSVAKHNTYSACLEDFRIIKREGSATVGPSDPLASLSHLSGVKGCDHHGHAGTRKADQPVAKKPKISNTRLAIRYVWIHTLLSSAGCYGTAGVFAIAAVVRDLG